MATLAKSRLTSMKHTTQCWRKPFKEDLYVVLMDKVEGEALTRVGLWEKEKELRHT